jgi:hypothetical protein
MLESFGKARKKHLRSSKPIVSSIHIKISEDDMLRLLRKSYPMKRYSSFFMIKGLILSV